MFKSFISAAIFSLVAAPAMAATITFGSGSSGHTSIWTEAGYRVTWTGNTNGDYLINAIDCTPDCADSGTRAAWGGLYSDTINLQRTDGGAFSLFSFLGAETFAGFQSYWATDINVTANLAGGGTVSQLFTLDQVNDGPGGVADFQLFTLNSGFGSVTSVSFDGIFEVGRIEDSFTIDTLQVSDALASPVPEPATLSLLGLGLAGVAAVRFRRRK